jgi:GT2 family glycosyltransferase
VAPVPIRISVLIVNYRTYPELTSCLTTLLADPSPAREVIVVDQASDAAAAGALRSRFPAVPLLAVETNKGFAAGVNRGASIARGEYFLVLNPDATIDPAACDVLADWLDAHPAVAVAGPVIRDLDGRVQGSARRFPNVLTGLAGRTTWLTRAFPGNPLSRRNIIDPTDRPSEVDWVSGACLMVRRAAFESVGGLDEGFFLYWEDADFCRRLKARGWRTMYVPEATAVHAAGRSSAHARAQSIGAFHASAFRYYWKHGGVLARALAPAAYVVLQARRAIEVARSGRSVLQTPGLQPEDVRLGAAPQRVPRVDDQR